MGSTLASGAECGSGLELLYGFVASASDDSVGLLSWVFGSIEFSFICSCIVASGNLYLLFISDEFIIELILVSICWLLWTEIESVWMFIRKKKRQQ